MEKTNSFTQGNMRTIYISLAVIIAAVVLTFAVINRNKNDEQIKVTGLGEKDFQSDLIVWNGTFSQTGTTLKDAYEKLNNDQEKIKVFLGNKNINNKEIVFSAVNIGKEYEDVEDRKGNRIQKQIGYRLQQNVKIESNDIEKIENVSREITELINNGVEFYSQEPQYYFTRLNDLKIELIELATKNGKERAEKIAEKSGYKLGKLKYANLGVFQIIAQNSNKDYSWSGSYDTFSKNKTATITIRMQFGIR